MDNGDTSTLSTDETLNAIRDQVLILTLGNTYLCEDPFLIKLGRVIEQNIEPLREAVSSLKSRFPGKFANEIDTDEILEGLHKTAMHMQKPDTSLNDRCIVGQLGRDLEDRIKSLSAAISTIRARVEVGDLTYTKTDSILSIFGGSAHIGSSIGNAFNLGLKVIIFLMVIAVILFFFLFLSMENTEVLLKEVSTKQEQIDTQREIMTGLDLDREKISQKITAIEKRAGSELTPKARISIMELEMALNKIDEKRIQVELDLAIHQEILVKNQKKIEEFNRKSFMRRLLRL